MLRGMEKRSRVRVRSRAAGLLVALVFITMLAAGCGAKGEEEAKPTEIPVEVQAVERADVSKVAVYAGTLRGIEEATVYPKISAMSGALKVVAVNVKPGDRVRAGQSLVQLDGSDLGYQIRASEAQLEGLIARKAGTEGRVANAKQTLDRTRFLFEQGAVSKAELERVETEYQAAKAGLDELNAGIAGAQANLDNVRNNLANCNVPSPIDGIVGIVNVNVGDSVTAQSPVAVVTDTSRLEVQVNVSEAEVSFVQPDQGVRVYVDAVASTPFTGKVTSVAQAADARSKTYPVKISLDNKNGALKSGMFAEVHLTTVSKQDAIAVPRDAVAEKSGRRVVYVVDDRNVAHEKDVQLGIEGQELVEIIKGVQVGDRIIVKGQTLIDHGDKVRVVAGGVKK